MRSSAETHKRRREGCRDTPQSPSGDDRWTGKSTEELKAMLDRSQTQIDALQKKCTSQQKEIDGMEHDILKIYNLMLRCGSFEKVLREEWQYCAPPLPSSEGQDDGGGTKARLGQRGQRSRTQMWIFGEHARFIQQSRLSTPKSMLQLSDTIAAERGPWKIW